MERFYSRDYWYAFRMDEEGTFKVICPYVPDEVNYSESILRPANGIRSLFREIEAEDILYFYTGFSECLYVRKKETLAKMIEALRDAVHDSDLRTPICYEMQVVFDREKFAPKLTSCPEVWENWVISSPEKIYLTLREAFTSPAYCYGPQFYTLLCSLTPEDAIADRK